MKIKEALEDGTLSLEDEIDYADMTEEEYKQEIERLNNIINELEKYLNQKIESLEKLKEELNVGCKLAYKDSLDKLQELKGSDKE